MFYYDIIWAFMSYVDKSITLDCYIYCLIKDFKNQLRYIELNRLKLKISQSSLNYFY